ncbi:Hypothetical protein NTJ_13565 [Nesidiocoris tenuis]|nr:Hypothetical protein NTJ_13565 [Nesidiocoris tenuis]
MEVLPKKIPSQPDFSSIGMNPISDVVGLDCCRLPKRCASTIDFASAPPHDSTAELPLIEKLLFLDTTVVEEMQFPRLSAADLEPESFPELRLVPLFDPKNMKRSHSLPAIAIGFDSKSLKCSPNKCL